VAGRTAHQQHTAGTARILLLALGLLNALARLEPLDWQLELGAGEAVSGFSLARALAVLVIRLPGDRDDVGNLALDVLELRVVEPLAQPALELLAREPDIPLTFPHVDHAPSITRTGRSSHARLAA
jgi:hypothetical protein